MKYAADLDFFIRNVVNLNDDRLNRLQKRVDAVESFIMKDETFGDMFVDMIPAGSWAQRSIIKPVKSHDTFDADVLLELIENEDWEAKDYIENLYNRFRTSSNYRGIVQKKKRCVRIDYADEFHIDLVPHMERSDQHYITNREEPEETGRFELSNPEGFTEWVHNRQLATNGRFIKVVRLLKYLRDHKDRFSCKSIILTTLLGEQVNLLQASLDTKLYADTPTTLLRYLKTFPKLCQTRCLQSWIPVVQATTSLTVTKTTGTMRTFGSGSSTTQ